MFDYLQQFNNLPKSLRDKVSSPVAMRLISDLEKKYKVDLAAVVMKVMTKVLSVNSLSDYFVSQAHLSRDLADNLKKDLLSNIFAPVSEYLGISPKQLSPEDRKQQLESFNRDLSQEIGISLASDSLQSRLQNIITTYLKGIRTKIVTKDSLMKKVDFGGLGLSDEEAERVLDFVELKKIETRASDKELRVEDLLKNKDANHGTKESSRDKLNKIIMEAETGTAPGYSLKNSILEKKEEKILLAKKEDKVLLEKKEQKLLTPSNLPLADDEEVKQERKEDEKAKDVGSEPKVEIKSETEAEKIEAAIKEINSAIETKKKAETEDGEKKDLSEVVGQESLKKEELKTETKQQSVQNKELPKTDIKQEDVTKKGLKKEDPEKDFNTSRSKTLNLNFSRPALSSSRPKIQDIKPVVKVVSPIDELRLLNVTNFRRLGDNSKEIVLKIFSKIKLLERDGYDKMVEGVKAWRQSEVNRLYVKMGQEIIMNNISLEDVIAGREKKSIPYLKPDEINAISQLNSKLSF